MWVRIVRERRLLVEPHHRVCVHYTPGLVLSIKRAWGERLIAAGDAVEVAAPRRSEAPT